MRFIIFGLFLALLVSCGKNDNFTSTQLQPNPFNQGAPPNAPGYRPNFNVPQGYNSSFYYFSALYNYYAYMNQLNYWNQIWQSWSSYSQYYGYSAYNFNAFWNQYAATYDVIDTRTYDWFDIYVYSYYGY